MLRQSVSIPATLAAAAAAMSMGTGFRQGPARNTTDGSQETGIQIQRIDLRNLPQVDVRFTVRDPRGRYLQGLTKSDVKIEIDSGMVNPSQFSFRFPSGAHIQIMLVIDASGSMRSNLAGVRRATGNLLSRLSEADTASIVVFSDSVTVLAPPTSHRDRLGAQLALIHAAGHTALYDALGLASSQLSAHSGRFRDIIAVTDGKDNRSRATPIDIEHRLRAEGIPLFVVALGNRVDSTSLKALSDATGGRYFGAPGAGDLRQVYQDLAGELVSQYRVLFALPPSAQGRWTTLKLLVSPPPSGPPDTAFFAEHIFLASLTQPMSPASGERPMLGSDLEPTALAVTLFFVGALILGTLFSWFTRRRVVARRGLIAFGLLLCAILASAALSLLWRLIE
jgi:VWFA-related protein